MKLTFAVAFVPALYLSWTSAAFARPVELEVGPQKLLLEVGDTMCASLHLRTGKAPRSVKVCPVKSGYQVEVHLEDVDLEAHAGSGANQRVVLGRFDRPDGTRLEIAMTPR